jgi:hypothetical protein
MKTLLTIAITIFCSVNLFAQTKSVYTGTTVKDCKPTKESTDGGYVGLCNGTGGYKLKFMEGDLRQTLNVITPGKKEVELNLWSTVSSGFSSIGEKVEWRMKGTVPMSFIVRFNASENPDDSTKITSYLVVVKLAKTSACITDIVKPSKTQNLEAQKLADAASKKPCLAFE